jgi:hypothetical protein
MEIKENKIKYYILNYSKIFILKYILNYSKNLNLYSENLNEYSKMIFVS